MRLARSRLYYSSVADWERGCEQAVGRRLRRHSSLNGVDSVQALWPCEGDRWRASMRAKEHFWRHPARLFALHPARLITKGTRMSTIRVMFYIFYVLPAAQKRTKRDSLWLCKQPFSATSQKSRLWKTAWWDRYLMWKLQHNKCICFRMLPSLRFIIRPYQWTFSGW